MAKPFISLFDVTPNSIDKGDKVIFRWGVSNADTRTLTVKGSIAPVGSWSFYPAYTRTYTLTATNSEGTSKKYQTVTVAEPEPPPPETFTLTFNTTPGNCLVAVAGHGSYTSSTSGVATFYNLYTGIYSYTVTKEGYTTATGAITLTEDDLVIVLITEIPDEPPPPPPEAPDFWDSPEDWIKYFVITTLENMLGWTGSSFIGLLHQVKSFFDNSWTQIAAFFSDVSQGVKDALGSTLTGIQDWLDSSFNNIGEWWDSTTSDIGEWWNSTTEDVGNWWTSVSGDIGDWWTGSIEDFNAAISNATEGFLIWGEGLLTDIWEGIQGWVIDLITGLIESFNAGFDQGIEDQKNEREGEDWIGGK